MSEGGQPPARGAAAINTGAKRSTAQAAVIDVNVAGWTWRAAVDLPPSTGALRDLAETIAAVVGCDLDVALDAVVATLESALSNAEETPVTTLEAAA